MDRTDGLGGGGDMEMGGYNFNDDKVLLDL